MRQKEIESKFRCARCGYLTQRQAPPKSCPVCRTASGSFDDVGVTCLVKTLGERERVKKWKEE